MRKPLLGLTSLFMVLLSLGAFASPAAAAPFTITNTYAEFVNPVPLVTVNNADPDHITARWGDPATNGGQSGYNFDSTVPPVIGGVVPPDSPWFLLGNFTHLNQPVTDTTLDHIGLNVGMDFTIGATAFNNVIFGYLLTHEETTNQTPCPFPSSPTPCDDRVTVSNPSSGVFTIGSTQYTLELGFSKDGGANILHTFVTTEGQNNLAGLYGRFSSDETVVPDPQVSEVPEPASLMLLGSGLMVGLRKVRARRRA